MQEWVRTQIVVNHRFTLEQLGRFDQLAVSLWRDTTLEVTRVIEYTNAARELTCAERQARLCKDDGLFFELHGGVMADCLVGRQALALTLENRSFAWQSPLNITTDFQKLLLLVGLLTTSCSSTVAVVAPATRMAASAMRELVCEGMTVERAMQRIIEVDRLVPQDHHQMARYFAQGSASRYDQADTYFCLREPFSAG